MFTLITRYNSVKQFLLEGKTLFLATDTSLVLKEDDREVIISDQPVYTFRYFNGNIFFQNENGTAFHIYDLRTGKITSIEGVFYLWLSYVESDKIFITGKANGSRKIFFIHGTTLHETALTDSPYIVHENVAINALGKLEAKDIYTGKQYWLKKFEEPLDMEGEVYKSGNNIIVPLNDGRVLGLDIFTGEQRWELTDCLPSFAQHPVTGWLYGYGGTAYEVIDPVNGIKVIEKDFTAVYKELKVLPTAHQYYIDEDRMYFVSNYLDVRFGAVDLVNHSMSFVQVLDVAPGVTGYIPQHVGGKLCILDTESVLHVFKADAD